MKDRINKTFSIWLCGAMLAIAANLFADTQKVGNYTWTYQINDNCAKIYGYYSSSDGCWQPSISPKPTGAVSIPSSLGGMPVRIIGEDAFLSCRDMTDVMIPDTVTNIERSAFFSCCGLTNLSIPATVTNIDDAAFCYCSGLLSISVESENTNYKSIDGLLLTKDGTRLLQGINGGDMKIPDSVTTIRSDAFYGCKGLTSIAVPDSVIALGDSAFYGCAGLTNVLIGAGVASFSDRLFAGCSSIKDFVIPDGIIFTGDSAFEGCSELTNVVIGSGVTSISYQMFNGCSSLRKIYIPSGVTSIERWAFNGCSGLTSVSIPNGLTSIGDYAFYNCTSLSAIDIPDSVTSVGQNAFDGCSDALFDTTTISGIKLLSGWVVGNTGALYGTLNLSGVRGICDEAFYGCNELTSVILPDSITSIGYRMFYNCTALVSVTIPNSVITIGNGAFAKCTKLSNVTLPNSVKSFGSAFENCTGLKNIMIGSGVTSIDSFSFRGCSNLASATIIGNGATVIDSFAFRDCANLTRVTIGDGVTSIGIYAFDGCGSLESVSIGNGVTSIGSYSFYNCSSLTTLTIGKSVKTIGHYAFNGCSSLTSVTIPALMTSIGGYAFENCSSLSLVTLPKGLETKNIFPSTATFRRYTPIQVVTLDVNGGMCATENINVVFGNAYGDLPIPTRVGCSFGRWTLDGMTIYTNTVVTAMEDHTLIAQWQCTVSFDANGGTCKTTSKTVQYGKSIGSMPTPTKQDAAFIGWFTEAEGGDKVDQTLVITQGKTLYAHWLTEVENPVITSSTGVEFRMDCEITITSATEGAKIYYTVDGTTPKKNTDYLYSGPITITETTTFKAIAVFGGISSGYVTTTITKRPLTLAEVLDVETNNLVTLITDAANPWTPILDATAKVGDSSARSGAIGHGTNTWLCALVSGAGTLSFWYKSSCEHDEDNAFTWDRVMVFTNDVEIANWRIDGETDWTNRTISFSHGENTVKWVYYKDKSYANGEDCAWLDGLVWTPDQQPDPIPDLGDNPTAQQIEAALKGSADAKLSENITDGTTYGQYRNWASKVKAKGGSSAVGADAVRNAPNAWLSFALGSETLIETAPTDGDLKVVNFEPATESGKFDFTVSVKKIKVGSDADADNLKKVFGLEGGTTLEPGGLSSDNVNITFGTPENGKVKFTAGPKNTSEGTFFMKVKMTP